MGLPRCHVCDALFRAFDVAAIYLTFSGAPGTSLARGDRIPGLGTGPYDIDAGLWPSVVSFSSRTDLERIGYGIDLH